MAIIRSGPRVSRASTHSSSSTHDDLPVKQAGRRGISVDDSDTSADSEPIEIDAEMCQLGDDICAVPLELFDVADLRKILSLDTWNYCLTEDERESLFALLPSMGEESYRCTLKELLAGEIFHFTSPLTDLFERLKGGLCNPQVARYHDSLKYLQRKEHYHRVRKYHNSMVNCFVEMQNIWQNQPSAHTEERLEMWNSWKFKKTKPQLNGFSEVTLEPARNHLVQGLLNRKAKFLKSKEISKSSHRFLDEAAVPAMPHAGGATAKADRKLKKELDLTLKSSYGKLPGNFVKLGPKGLKRVSKGSSKRHLKLEVGVAQALDKNETGRDLISAASMEGDSTAVGRGRSSPAIDEAPTMERSTASPVKEKLPKMKAENKRKGREKEQQDEGAVKKRRRVKEVGENGSRIVKEESDQVGEIFRDESTEVTAQKALVEVEQMQDDMSCLDASKNEELKKKYRRRAKIKVKGLAEEASIVKTEHGEDAYVAEKGMEIKDEHATDVSKDKPTKRRKKPVKSEDGGTLPHTPDGEPVLEKVPPMKTSRKPPPPSVPPVVMSFPFSVIHLVSAVRTALTAFPRDKTPETGLMHTENAFTDNSNGDGAFLMSPEAGYLQQNDQSLQGEDTLDVVKEEDDKKSGLPATPLQEIVRRVQANPGDVRILETQEPLQGLVRGVLKVLSSKSTQPAIKGWKPFVAYDRDERGWSWIGPLPPLPVDCDTNEVQITVEAWAVPQKTLYKIQELFGNWLKHEQEILQQLGQLALSTPPLAAIILDEKERFRELRAQKSLITINPTSEEMRAHFQREEALRYSVPDRAFSYTSGDGRKSVVAPLRRIGGKPNSKARDHFMLKSDRPPHVTILCLVRDAAARLPGSIGTRADVCALIRDSQFIVEDVSDAQLNQVVSGALDRLHYERDPCVRFDGDRKLWVYLHTDKDEEDFEDDATSSTKRWKRSKKEGIENPDSSLVQEYDYPGRDDQDPCGLGLDFSPTSCFGGPDLSAVYSTTGRPELIYSHQNGSLASPHVLGSGFPGQVREEGALPFIELPPSIQPPCVNMQQSHPMGWEVLGNRWDQDTHFQSHDHIMQDDYGPVVTTASQENLGS